MSLRRTDAHPSGSSERLNHVLTVGMEDVDGFFSPTQYKVWHAILPRYQQSRIVRKLMATYETLFPRARFDEFMKMWKAGHGLMLKAGSKEDFVFTADTGWQLLAILSVPSTAPTPNGTVSIGVEIYDAEGVPTKDTVDFPFNINTDYKMFRAQLEGALKSAYTKFKTNYIAQKR